MFCVFCFFYQIKVYFVCEDGDGTVNFMFWHRVRNRWVWKSNFLPKEKIVTFINPAQNKAADHGSGPGF